MRSTTKPKPSQPIGPPPIGAVTTSYLAMRANHCPNATTTAAQDAAQRLDRAHRLLPFVPVKAAEDAPTVLYVPAEIVAEMAERAELTGAWRVAARWREVAAEMRLGELKAR